MFKSGNLPGAVQLPSGTILVDIVDHTDSSSQVEKKTIVYARVSTPKQKSDMETQSERIESFCAANGWTVYKTYKEIASGLNDNRPILGKILTSDEPIRLVVEHKDRLTRFGFKYIETLFDRMGWELVVINHNSNDQDDLMTDFVSIITSMTARLYGLRRATRKTERIIQELNND